MNDSAFEQWYNGMVGFHINSERILDDLNGAINEGGTELSPESVRRWMVVCWNNAIDAVEENMDTSDYTRLFNLLREKT